MSRIGYQVYSNLARNIGKRVRVGFSGTESEGNLKNLVAKINFNRSTAVEVRELVILVNRSQLIFPFEGVESVEVYDLEFSQYRGIYRK